MTIVKPAQPADAEALAELAEEMDRFYGATEFDPVEVRVRQINEAIFSDPPSAYALLAWNDGGRLVGLASYSYLWPAVGLTRSLFLKELYISESVGKQLMHTLYEIAPRHGVQPRGVDDRHAKHRRAALLQGPVGRSSDLLEDLLPLREPHPPRRNGSRCTRGNINHS
ncbi:MAG: GNAT family N-acetyltransferase [Mycobacteriales bacterium]